MPFRYFNVGIGIRNTEVFAVDFSRLHFKEWLFAINQDVLLSFLSGDREVKLFFFSTFLFLYFTRDEGTSARWLFYSECRRIYYLTNYISCRLVFKNVRSKGETPKTTC